MGTTGHRYGLRVLHRQPRDGDHAVHAGSLVRVCCAGEDTCLVEPPDAVAGVGAAVPTGEVVVLDRAPVRVTAVPEAG